MGGRGGSSLRDQSGAMKQAGVIGAGIGPSGAAEEGAGGAAGSMGLPVQADGTAIAGHHGHSHGPMGIGRCCGALGKAISGPLFQILGLDRFTKGKSLSGMKRAGSDQNPFDLGLMKVCSVEIGLTPLELSRLLDRSDSNRL